MQRLCRCVHSPIAGSYHAPAPNRRGIKRWCCPVWRLSVAYIGLKSRTERLRKTKIGTEVAHVTRDSDTTFKVKRSRSPGLNSPRRLHIRQLQRWAWVTVGTYFYVDVCRRGGLGGAKRFDAHRGRRGRGISWRPPAYSLFYCARPAVVRVRPVCI